MVLNSGSIYLIYEALLLFEDPTVEAHKGPFVKLPYEFRRFILTFVFVCVC